MSVRVTWRGAGRAGPGGSQRWPLQPQPLHHGRTGRRDQPGSLGWRRGVDPETAGQGRAARHNRCTAGAAWPRGARCGARRRWQAGCRR